MKPITYPYILFDGSVMIPLLTINPALKLKNIKQENQDMLDYN